MSFNTKEKNGINSTIYKYDAFDNLIKKRHFSEDRLRLDSVLYVYDESNELLRETSYTSSNYQSTIEYEKVMDTVFVHRVNIRNYKEIKSIHQTYTDSLRQKWYLLVEPNPKKHKISGLDSFVRKYNEQGDLIETRVINESNEEVTLSKKKIEYDEFNRKVLEKSYNGKNVLTGVSLIVYE